MSIACIHNENAADCVCGCAGLVAAVRADERERIAQEIEHGPHRLGHDVSVVCSCLRCEVTHAAARIARGLS